MAKYVSRFHLGLSNSVPGIVVKQENIRFIDDIGLFFLLGALRTKSNIRSSSMSRDEIQHDGWCRKD